MRKLGFFAIVSVFSLSGGLQAFAQQYPGQDFQGTAVSNGYQTYGNAACGPTGQCQEPSPFWTNYYRNVYWPTPFTGQDLNAVTSYFNIQRENGWRLHNTVGNVLFDPQSNCLTGAGKDHVRSIVTTNPSARREIFVLHGATPQQTAQRIESVQVAVSTLLPTGELPQIYTTDRDAPGSRGDYQTKVYRDMMTKLPGPVLPPSTASQNGP